MYIQTSCDVFISLDEETFAKGNSKTNCLFIALRWPVKSTSPPGNQTLQIKKKRSFTKGKYQNTLPMWLSKTEYIQWKYSQCYPAIREQAYKTESSSYSSILCLTHALIHSKHFKDTQTYIHERTSAYKPAVSHPAQSQSFNPVSHLNLFSRLAGSDKSRLNSLSPKPLQPK